MASKLQRILGAFVYMMHHDGLTQRCVVNNNTLVVNNNTFIPQCNKHKQDSPPRTVHKETHSAVMDGVCDSQRCPSSQRGPGTLNFNDRKHKPLRLPMVVFCFVCGHIQALPVSGAASKWCRALRQARKSWHHLLPAVRQVFNKTVSQRMNTVREACFHG